MKSLVRLLLEGIALAALIGGTCVVAVNYRQLPEIIPIHFGISGAADGFGSKIWLPMLTILSIVMYITMTVARRFPQCSNTPWKITDENRQRQYALIQSLLTWLKAENAVLFAFLQWTMVQIALGADTALNPVFMGIWAASLIATIGTYFYFGYRAR